MRIHVRGAVGEAYRLDRYDNKGIGRINLS